MLRRLGLGCLDGRILIRCRPSIIGLRPIHHAPSSGRRREPSDSPPAAAIDDPGWVMLNEYAIRTDDSFVADAKTVAYARTSTGHHLRVSFKRAPPPASSFLYYDFADTAPGEAEDSVIDECDADKIEDDDENESEVDDADESEDEDFDVDDWSISVVAAHGDSVLLKMSDRRFRSSFEDDHFLYRTGAALPPSMSLLPDRDFLTKSEQVYARHAVSPPIRPIVHSGTTALLRRGVDDVLLVQLHLKYDRSLRQHFAEFCLLRHGNPQWELMEPVPIIQYERHEQLRTRSGTDTIFPVGNRFLCWVGHETGFFLCDMVDETSPRVRYVPLPSGVIWEKIDYERDMLIKHSKNIGATGASTVRYVSVDPHCCCGGQGRSTCLHSRYAFTINTWTMNDLSVDEPLEWVKDGEIDSEELWALPGYEGLQRVNPQCPVMSLDNPNVVCFLVSNYHFSSWEDQKAWMIQLNIKTKTLLSVVEYTNDDSYKVYCHLPAKLQC